jgi:hypothetical protein
MLAHRLGGFVVARARAGRAAAGAARSAPCSASGRGIERYEGSRRTRLTRRIASMKNGLPEPSTIASFFMFKGLRKMKGEDA